MAVGDLVAGHSSIANGNYLTIQPGAGIAWIIVNIEYDGAVEFYKTDGTNEIKFDEDTVAGMLAKFGFLITNSKYLRVKNVSGGAIYIGYDGAVFPLDILRDGHSQIADNGFLTIQPSGAEEWILHNIYCGGTAELYKTDGTNDIKIDTISGSGAWLMYKFHLSNSIYIRVKNVSGGSAYFGYEAIKTK